MLHSFWCMLKEFEFIQYGIFRRSLIIELAAADFFESMCFVQVPCGRVGLANLKGNGLGSCDASSVEKLSKQLGSVALAAYFAGNNHILDFPLAGNFARHKESADLRLLLDDQEKPNRFAVRYRLPILFIRPLRGGRSFVL